MFLLAPEKKIVLVFWCWFVGAGVGARKQICTAPFLDAQEIHSRSTCKAVFHIFLQISV